jgi:hypothetical protein
VLACSRQADPIAEVWTVVHKRRTNEKRRGHSRNSGQTFDDHCEGDLVRAKMKRLEMCGSVAGSGQNGLRPLNCVLPNLSI